MDWDSRNAAGVAPLKALIEQVEAIGSIEELNACFTQTPEEDQWGSLWGGGAMVDLTDSNRHVPTVTDAGLLLEDSAEYKELTPYGAIVKQAVTELAGKMLVKLGYSEAEAAQKIDNCFAFCVYTAQGRSLSVSLCRNPCRGGTPVLLWVKNAGGGKQ